MKLLKQKVAPECLHNPEKCPCKKKSCPRYRKCEECKAHHAAKRTRPYCER